MRNRQEDQIVKKLVPHFWVAAAGVGLTFLGLIGPWAKVISLISISVNGLDVEDGKYLALAAAAAGVLLALYALRKRTELALVVTAILGLVIVGDGIYYLVKITNGIDEARSEYVHASVGWGLYAMTIGGAMIAFGSLFTMIKARSEKAPAVEPAPDAVLPPVQR
jgi:hypothetical protein